MILRVSLLDLVSVVLFVDFTLLLLLGVLFTGVLLIGVLLTVGAYLTTGAGLADTPTAFT